MSRDLPRRADDPIRQVRDARRAFAKSIAAAVVMSVFLTGGVALLIATVPSPDEGGSWNTALPRLSLTEALTLITVFLVVYGFGVIRGPGAIQSSSTDDAATSMTDQQLREIAVVAGWAGTAVALWAAVDALAGWQTGGLTAGASAGRLLAALMAGVLMASLAALVPIRYPPHIQALVDAGRRANEVRIFDQLRAWGVSPQEITAVRNKFWARATKLVLPVLTQALVPCALTIGYLALRYPASAASIVGLGVAAFICAAVGAVTLVAPVAFFRATPRAPILGTASLVYPLLYALLSVGYVATTWGRPVELTLWCTPIVAIGLRLGMSMVVRRSGPSVAHGLWALVDRRWLVAAYLETSQSARIAAAATATEPSPVRGYM